MRGTLTALDPAIVEAAARSLQSWFGPGEPPTPLAPASVQGRAFDYPVGFNMQQRPKVTEGITHTQLRNLADGYDLLRLAIETRKDQIDPLLWTIRGRDGKDGGAEAKRIQEALRSPDRENTWHQWLRVLLEELLVIDAPAIYVRRTVGGEPWALEILDGATIKRVLDASGRTPQEGTAYQQILHGVTAANFDRSELIYAPRNLRANRVYGFSPVEQVVATVNIALRRQLHQLSYYTEGNTPNLIFGVPKEWSASQIKEYQTQWDSMLSGNIEARSRARFVPADVKPFDTKEAALKDAYDEWLARIICYAFSLSPQALVQQMNRATAETAQETAVLEGLKPLQNWLKGLMDRILRDVFLAPHLEFAWEEEEAIDPLERAQVHRAYVESGVIDPDEVREEIGLKRRPAEPEGGTFASAPGGAAAVQDTAMNGAQVASLMQIVESAAQGRIPKETARAMIRAAFPALDDKEVAAIVDPVEVKKPEPLAPATPPPAQAPNDQGAKAPVPEQPKGEPSPTAAEKLIKAKRMKPLDRGGPLRKKMKARIQKRVAAFLHDQVRAVAEAVHAGLQKVDRAEAIRILEDLNLDFAALGDEMEPLLAAIAQSGGIDALRQIGKLSDDLVDLVNEKAVAWAEAHAAELVKGLADTTRDSLRSALVGGIEEGMSVDEIAAALEEAYGFSERRAELIAQTELRFADVRGNTLAYAESGVVGGLEWVTVNDGNDDRICPNCEMNDGIVVGMDAHGNATEPFPSGVTTVPEHPGCRCDLLPVLSEEE